MRKKRNFQPQLQKRHHHIKNSPLLYVKRISRTSLEYMWLPHHPGKPIPPDVAYYIECSKSGRIDWKAARVFTLSQIVGRDNVVDIQ